MIAISVFVILVFVLLLLMRRAIRISRLSTTEATLAVRRSHELEADVWWAKKRWKYNKGLIVSGIAAFVAYVLFGSWLIMPYDQDFEITLFTTFFQGIGYLFMILIANICYGLGPLVDAAINPDADPRSRLRLFNLGFWFSCVLPFLIPVWIVNSYFREFA